MRNLAIYGKFFFFSVCCVTLISLLVVGCASDAITSGGSCNDGNRCTNFVGSQYNYVEQSTKCAFTFTEAECPTTNNIGTCVVDSGKSSERKVTYYSSFGSTSAAQDHCTGDNGTYLAP